MNLYDFNYMSRNNRTKNIIQYNPKLIKKVEFQGSKTPLNSVNKKKVPNSTNQSKYKYNFGLVNKRNIIQSYEVLKTNYNSKLYSSIHSFNIVYI